ncbi:MAG: TraR/DksA C4-type zinc finger protein [Candidatus Marinimicrobia bacterium]|nr:TraR/DksA C4-type zinc finger protein [Candidatus Neomarinimicrobiota bacterium]
MAIKKQYSKAKLNSFKKQILARLDDVNHEVDDMKKGVVNQKPTKSMSPDSIYSVHMADAGSDSHQLEKNFLFIARENNYIKNLENALERIDSGHFGVCVLCGELIPEERMIEVPNATKCVDCKTKDKLNIK